MVRSYAASPAKSKLTEEIVPAVVINFKKVDSNYTTQQPEVVPEKDTSKPGAHVVRTNTYWADGMGQPVPEGNGKEMVVTSVLRRVGETLPKRKRKHIRIRLPSKPEKRLFANPDAPENIIWMWLHMVIIETQFYQIPYFNSFEYGVPFVGQLDALELFYVVDLIKRAFVTGYYDEDGKLVYSRWRLFLRQLETLDFWWEISGIGLYVVIWVIIAAGEELPFDSPVPLLTIVARLQR